MKPIVLWGATGQSIVLHEIIMDLGYSVRAIIDNNTETVSPFKGITLIHGKDEFEKWKGTQTDQLYYSVAIGGDKGYDRLEIGKYLESKGLLPVTLIHKTAYIGAEAIIGKGAQVLAQAAVCVRVSLGDQVIINTAASVDHESRIGDGTHIGPGAKLAGCVEIGDHSFIGTGAVILPRIKIGNNVTVGAGAVVTRDLPDHAIAYGNPAKVISYKNAGK